MDVLRAALGEETLTYFGASYGTKLGATYAELFPDRVGRLVLDGAVDVVARQPAARPRAGRRLRDRAARLRRRTASTRPTTASSATPSTRGWPRIRELLDDLDATPLPTGRRPRAAPRATPSTASSRRSTTATTGSCSSAALAAGARRQRHRAAAARRPYASRGPDGYTDNSSRRSTRSTASTTPTSVAGRRGRRELPRLRGGLADLRPDLRLALTDCRGSPVADRPRSRSRSAARAPRRSWSSAPPATRPRPLKWAEALADAARLRRAGAPRRRRPHRLQRGQRVRRQRHRGLPPRRRRAGRPDRLLRRRRDFGRRTGRAVILLRVPGWSRPAGQRAALAQSVERITRNE